MEDTTYAVVFAIAADATWVPIGTTHHGPKCSIGHVECSTKKEADTQADLMDLRDGIFAIGVLELNLLDTNRLWLRDGVVSQQWAIEQAAKVINHCHDYDHGSRLSVIG